MTQDPAVGHYLSALVGEARAVLGDGLLGAYAAGSLALDAFEPGRSDVDVALVTRGTPSGSTKRELVQRLRHESLECPARGLELVVYREGAARSGTPEPGFELELNTGAAMAFRATYDPAERPTEDGLFWYALDRSILHQSGVALFGPPAAEVFADPAPDDVRRLLVTSLRWWLDHADTADPAASDDAVLGACRALVRHRYGVWLAKADAGHRVLAEGLEPRAAAEVVEQGLAARRGGAPPDPGRARTFQVQVLDEISDGTRSARE